MALHLSVLTEVLEILPTDNLTQQLIKRVRQNAYILIMLNVSNRFEVGSEDVIARVTYLS